MLDPLETKQIHGSKSTKLHHANKSQKKIGAIFGGEISNQDEKQQNQARKRILIWMEFMLCCSISVYARMLNFFFYQLCLSVVDLLHIHVLALFGQVTIFFGILKYLCTALNLQLLINVVVICAAFQLCCLDRYLVIVWVYLLYVILIFANDDVSFANQSLVFLRTVNAGLVFCAHYALAHGMQFFISNYFPAVQFIVSFDGEALILEMQFSCSQ